MLSLLWCLVSSGSMVVRGLGNPLRVENSRNRVLPPFTIETARALNSNCLFGLFFA
jgi:hypothetical protein